MLPKRNEDVRVKFCNGILYFFAFRYCFTLFFIALFAEKKKDYAMAMENYTQCLNECNMVAAAQNQSITQDLSYSNSKFFKELRGEVMLRIAVLRKEMGALDQALQMCNAITSEVFGDSIRANTLCLKVIFMDLIA